MKREPTGRETVFADRISDKGLMSKIHEELMQFKRQKKKKHKTKAGNTHTTPSKTWAQRLSISPKAPQVPPDEQVREKTLRITHSRTRIETAARCRLAPVGTPAIHGPDVSAGEGVESRGPAHGWCVCNGAAAAEDSAEWPRRTKTGPPCDPASPRPGSIPRRDVGASVDERIKHTGTHVCTRTHGNARALEKERKKPACGNANGRRGHDDEQSRPDRPGTL